MVGIQLWDIICQIREVLFLKLIPGKHKTVATAVQIAPLRFFLIATTADFSFVSWCSAFYFSLNSAFWLGCVCRNLEGIIQAIAFSHKWHMAAKPNLMFLLRQLTLAPSPWCVISLASVPVIQALINFRGILLNPMECIQNPPSPHKMENGGWKSSIAAT